MDEVVDFERDFRRAKQGDSLIYTTLLGIKTDLSEPRLVPDLLGAAEPEAAVSNEQLDDSDTSDSDQSDEEDRNSSEDEDTVVNNDDEAVQKEKFKHPERQRDESPNSRRVSDLIPETDKNF
jgi:RIO kinase 1